MADNNKKIVVNKHYKDPSAITLSAFTNVKRQFPGTSKPDELLREGEIIISNSKENPGLFIIAVDPQSEGVINITSAEHIKLSSAYTESTKSGEELELSGEDTIADAFGKVSKKIKDVAENAMPNVGSGLVVDNDTLNVSYDNYTIKVNSNNKLYVDTSVLPGGGGGGGSYLPGQYIEIAGNVISVTGITPQNYVTTGQLENEIEGVKNYVDGKGYATTSDVDQAVDQAKTDLTEYVDSNFVKPEDVADTIADALEDAKQEIIEEAVGDAVSAATSAITDYLDGLDFVTRPEFETEIGRIDETIEENELVTSRALTELNGRVSQNAEDIVALDTRINNLDPSAIVLKGTTVESHDSEFVGLDGETHPAGVYMIMEFGSPDGVSTYSYSDVTTLISMGSEYLTESEYDAKVDAGEIDPNVTYYVYEDEGE